MTVRISMRSSIDDVSVAGDFMSIVHQLNVASANGMKLAILGSDDEPVAIHIANINTIRPEDDDSIFG